MELRQLHRVMASRNGQSVYDTITNGWARKVFDRNGEDRPAVSVPADFAEEYGVEVGDEVAITEADDDGAVLELHFE